MEIVKQYRYLEEFASDKGNETVTIERRIQEAAGIMAEIMASGKVGRTAAQANSSNNKVSRNHASNPN